MPDFGDDRVMGATRQDLERWLRDFTAQPSLAFRDGRMALRDGELDLTVRLDPAPARKLGMITFHNVRVRFEYPGEQAGIARAWIKKFDHYTQRGGG